MSTTSQASHTVAYIPARLGSERVPRKNLRHLGGRPLVNHVAATALQSSKLDHVYLNTESAEIAMAAAPTGIELYMRDPRLAAADVSTDEILYDFARAVPCKRIAVINPTAPFLTVATIDRVLAESDRAEPDATVFTTTRLHKHLVVRGQAINFSISGKSPRTQDLEPFDYINFIMFTIGRDKVLTHYEQDGHCLYVPPLGFMPMSGIECQDIDEEDDFSIAEAMMHRSVEAERMSRQY
jgi:CMP-N,N'-diacetyllegionaminic acid synthase